MKELLSKVTGFLIAIVFIFGVRYLFVTLMFELITIAFNIAFSWKTALGIWAIVELVSMAVRPPKQRNKNRDN